MYLNIEFVPPDPIKRQIIEFNLLVREQYQSLYNPNGEFCPPHLTVYSPYIPSFNLKRILDRIKKVTQRTSPFTIRLGRIDSFPEGTIHIQCHKSNQLFQLHSDIISELSHLRENYVDKEYEEKQGTFTANEKVMFMRYGDPYVMDNFFPHIAIATVSLEQTEISNVIQKLTREPIASNFEANTIYVRGWENAGESGAPIAELGLGL